MLCDLGLRISRLSKNDFKKHEKYKILVSIRCLVLVVYQKFALLLQADNWRLVIYWKQSHSRLMASIIIIKVADEPHGRKYSIAVWNNF